MLTRSKKRTRQGGFRAQFNTYNGQMIREKEPTTKTKKPQEMAAADGGGGKAKIWNDDRSNRGRDDQPDQDGDNRIIVRRDRGGVVLEIAYGEDVVEVEIDPESANNLIAHLRAALGG